MHRALSLSALLFLALFAAQPALAQRLSVGESHLDGAARELRLSVHAAVEENRVASVMTERRLGASPVHVLTLADGEVLRAHPADLPWEMWGTLRRNGVPMTEGEGEARPQPPAQPPGGWSWFWERWMSEALPVAEAERLFRDGVVTGVEMGEGGMFLRTEDGRLLYYSPPDQAARERASRLIEEANVPYYRAAPSGLIAFLVTLATFALVAGVIYGLYKLMLLAQARYTAWKSMRASRRNALTFADVAGLKEVKESLGDVVKFLREPESFKAVGARMPAGMLLEGEPGNGKTMLARALAGEAGVPFFFASGAEFIDKWVGTGPQRIRELFRMARRHPVSIVFIDEFDGIGGRRRGNDTDLGAESTRLVNQLLTELDGFERRNRVFLIAATNNADHLDPALVRSGRLDRKVFVPAPDVEGREGILRLHTKGMRLGEGVELAAIARGTPGMSGADVAAMCNEAAILAARQVRDFLLESDFRAAASTMLLGQKRGGAVMSERERRQVAYHEAGHALVSSLLPGCDPVRMATIAPHGRALGAVVNAPESDRFLLSRGEMRARMAVAMAGRAAEEIVAEHPDEVTGGAAADIRHATALARDMAARLGLNEEVGLIDLSERASPLTMARLDRAVRDEVGAAARAAGELLRANLGALHALAGTLLERESISGDEVRATLAVAHASVPDSFSYVARPR